MKKIINKKNIKKNLVLVALIGAIGLTTSCKARLIETNLVQAETAADKRYFIENPEQDYQVLSIGYIIGEKHMTNSLLTKGDYETYTTDTFNGSFNNLEIPESHSFYYSDTKELIGISGNTITLDIYKIYGFDEKLYYLVDSDLVFGKHMDKYNEKLLSENRLINEALCGIYNTFEPNDNIHATTIYRYDNGTYDIVYNKQTGTGESDKNIIENNIDILNNYKIHYDDKALTNFSFK